jgi:hypothetical protein
LMRQPAHRRRIRWCLPLLPFSSRRSSTTARHSRPPLLLLWWRSASASSEGVRRRRGGEEPPTPERELSRPSPFAAVGGAHPHLRHCSSHQRAAGSRASGA